MSWYYVGPDAKPVGPISIEELQGRRASGAIGLETYVIEAPVQNGPAEWKRYREVFPTTAPLPPLPPQPPPLQSAVPHPLFPSAAPSQPSPGGPVFTGPHPSTYRLPASHLNPWCSWGFGLSLASLPLLACLGVGLLLAPLGLIACIVGLVQVNHHPGQQGRGLAIGGILAALIALALALVVIISFTANSIRSSVQMSTEQTSNDSDSR